MAIPDPARSAVAKDVARPLLTVVNPTADCGELPNSQARSSFRRQGIFLVAFAAVCWSTAGFFVRLLPLDMWIIAFWRSLFAAAFLAAFTIVTRRRRGLPPLTLGLGLPELGVAACAAVSILAFIPALQMTSVANVSVIYSSTPVVTALLAALFLGEAFRQSMLLVGLLIALGTGLVVWNSGFGSDLIGNMLAGVMMATMAAVGVMIRGFRDRSLLGSICFANILVALVSYPLAVPAAVRELDILILLLFALIQVALPFVAFSVGARQIRASEAALIATLETPLAPIWVMIAFAEVPSIGTVMGGSLIMCTTIIYLARSGVRPGEEHPRLSARRGAEANAATPSSPPIAKDQL